MFIWERWNQEIKGVTYWYNTCLVKKKNLGLIPNTGGKLKEMKLHVPQTIRYHKEVYKYIYDYIIYKSSFGSDYTKHQSDSAVFPANSFYNSECIIRI